MGKGTHLIDLFRKAEKIEQPEQPVTRVQFQTKFCPPCAMQQAVWDSIVDGNFIDAKIFAFSRRSRKPGQVNTPKPLFINTHVLAAACGYFRSMFDFPDSVVISLNAGLPLGVETTFNLGEHGFESDYDAPDEGLTGGCSETQPPAALMLPERTVKAYVVRYTAYRTLRAIIWYIYTGEIAFSPNDSSESPSASAKSIYRFADEHRMGGLKRLAFDGIAEHIDSLGPPELVEETFSVFTSRYPELHGLYIERLRSQLSFPSGSKDAFRDKLSRYFSGEFPHSGKILTSLLQALMDGSAARDPRFDLSRGCDTIPRAYHEWPARTKKALSTSLDKGIFEDSHLVVHSGSASTEHSVYFARVADEEIGSPFSRLSYSEFTHQYDAEISLSAWQAIAYYMYTDCINFKPLTPQDNEISGVSGPSDWKFDGYPCSPREVLYLSRKLAMCDASINLMAIKMSSCLTPENVVEVIFSDPPLPPGVINRGVEIIRANRSNSRIRTQLQEKLEEGASGSSINSDAFSACFSGLFEAGATRTQAQR